MFLNFLNINNKILKLLILTGPIKFISSLGFIIFNIYMVNFIDKENLGNFLICLSLIVFLSIFSKAGLTYAVLRTMSILYNVRDKTKFFPQIKQILFTSTFISLILISLTIYFEDYIALNIYNNEDLRGLLVILVLSLPFYTFVQIQKSIIKSFKLPFIAPIADIGMILLIVIFFTYLSNFFGFALSVYRLALLFLLVNVVLFAFFNLLIFYLFINKFKILKKDEKINEEKILSNSLMDFFIIDFVNYAFVWGSIFICSFYLDAKNLADFSSVYWLAFSPLFLSIVLNSIYAPIFAIGYNSNNLIRLRDNFYECKKIGIIIGVPTCAIFLFLSSMILDTFFNINNFELNLSFKILIIAALIRIIFGPIQNALNMSNNENFVKKITLFISIAQIVAMFIAINFYGIIALSFVYLIFNIIKFYLLNKKFKKIISY